MHANLCIGKQSRSESKISMEVVIFIEKTRNKKNGSTLSYVKSIETCFEQYKKVVAEN